MTERDGSTPGQSSSRHCSSIGSPAGYFAHLDTVDVFGESLRSHQLSAQEEHHDQGDDDDESCGKCTKTQHHDRTGCRGNVKCEQRCHSTQLGHAELEGEGIEGHGKDDEGADRKRVDEGNAIDRPSCMVLPRI